MKTNPLYDVIIIGGSYAGLSAAMALGRTLRQVLIIDGGEPCNRQTPHSHNFLTQDGERPAEIAAKAKAKAQVQQYPTISFRTDLVSGARKIGENFEILTQSGAVFLSKKLILAMGIKDKFMDIPGLKECWGISVIHCPYCHGYENKGKKTGILAKGDRAYHLATLVSRLTDQLTIITSGPAEFETERLEKFQNHGIQLVEKEILEIQHEAGYLRQVIFKDGTKEDFEALYADIPFELPGNFIQELVCTINPAGRVQVDQFQQTNIPGVYACGDCTSMMRSVASAVDTGNIAGAMVNHTLSAAEF